MIYKTGALAEENRKCNAADLRSQSGVTRMGRRDESFGVTAYPIIAATLPDAGQTATHLHHQANWYFTL